MFTPLKKSLHGTTLSLALLLAASTSAWAQTAVTTSGPSFAGTTGISATGSGVSGAAIGAPAMSNILDAAPALGAARSARAAALSSANSANSADAANADTAKPEAQRTQGAMRAYEPSQFQRFVQESTGRLLPMHGQDLFDAPQAYTANSAVPAPDSYVLGPGDEVRLKVWGMTDIDTSFTLDRNGQVALPKVGVVMLAGVAVRDLDKTLNTQLSRVFTNFQSSATLGRLRGIQVYVVGQARQPGTFQLSSLSTLVNALFASGGPTPNGSMRHIELKRNGQTVTTFDVYDFIARGDKSKDVALLSGDVIVIAPVGPRVAVAGALDQAGIYELKLASTVSDILALSGGVPVLAQSQKALLERIAPGQTPPREVSELVLNAQGLQQTLRDGDVLTLLPISPAFANAVTLQGAVAESVRHRWFEGMKILDLIPAREALIQPRYYSRKNQLVNPLDLSREPAPTAGQRLLQRFSTTEEQINWDYAVIERLDRQTLQTELLPFNLGRAVLDRDPAHNVALRPGDVVTILTQADLRLPQARQRRLVRLEGELVAPGVYQTLPGETLPQLIERVGGLTPQAYVYGTEFSREAVRARQQNNLDTLVRKLEAQAQSQATTLATNLSGDRAAQAQALQQQQQAQLKSQIDRLRNAKSNGRLALELAPSTKAALQSLPALPLEDGDRVLIPATPGFVAALGAVHNENVFIYNPGKTVSDVLRSAGLAEDAEPDQAFVLRADGSVVARRDRGGFFGANNFDSLHVMPGDTVVVPTMIDRESRYNFIIRAAKDWTQIFANFGLGAAAIKTLRN